MRELGVIIVENERALGTNTPDGVEEVLSIWKKD